MNFYQNKLSLATAAIFSSLLLVAGYYELKKMKSIYKQDFGNGVVIYADDYVKTGKWVFNCKNSRLISRVPLHPPISEIEKASRLKIDDNMYTMTDIEKAQAKIAIKAITKIEGWYTTLRYLYSALGEASNLSHHYFDLLHTHDERQWAIKVLQIIDTHKKSTFEITAAPYDPETYTDYAKALEDAAKSCPVPQ